MSHLSPAGDRLRLTASPQDRAKVKEIPGARYEVATQSWLLPWSWGSALASRAVFGDSLTMEQAVADWGFRKLREHAAVAHAKEMLGPIAAFAHPGVAPYPFQNAGARFLDRKS